MSPPQKKAGEAAGCNITKEDTPMVVGSLTCAAAYGIYGACFSILGAALPELADKLNKSTADFGIAFTTRGVGYLIGTLISAWVLNIPNFPLSKPFLSCVFLVITGLVMFLVAGSTNFILIMVLFSFQGIGFGGIDMMVNCAVPELWGLRAQPWMQFTHTCFGFGAVIGPALVGLIGYKLSFVIIAVVSLAPMTTLSVGYILGMRNKSQTDVNEPLLSAADTEVENNTAINALVRERTNTATSTSFRGILEEGTNHPVPPRKDTMNSVTSNSGANKSSGPASRRPSKDHSVHSNRTTSSKQSSVISNGPFSDPLNCRKNPSVRSAQHQSTDTEAANNTTENIEEKTYKIPNSIKYLTTFFYFVYMGYESGFAGWVPTYAIDMGVTSSNSDAAYLTSIYWAAITGGRLIAIFVAIYLTATQMIRIKLFMCIAFSVLLVLVADTTYTNLCISTAMFGFAVSSIFPLAMTVVSDYGFNMDANTTTMFMIGTTTGESILPVLIGLAMQYIDTRSMPYIMLACSSLLVLIYCTVNGIGRSPHHFTAGNLVITESNLNSHNSRNSLMDSGSADSSPVTTSNPMVRE